MHRIRWKTKYATGDPFVDRLHRELVDLVGELAAELDREEHCQDMNDLLTDLVEATRAHLEGRTEGSNAGTGQLPAIFRLLAEGFPLATRSTPACRDCGLCDRVQQRLRAWLAAALPAGDRPAH
jgi:hypothetical protein